MVTFQMPGQGPAGGVGNAPRRGGVLLPTIVILGVLVLGLGYEIKKGALQWEK